MGFKKIKHFIYDLHLKILIKKVRREFSFLNLTVAHISDAELIEGSKIVFHTLGKAGFTTEQSAEMLGSIIRLGLYGTATYIGQEKDHE